MFRLLWPTLAVLVGVTTGAITHMRELHQLKVAPASFHIEPPPLPPSSPPVTPKSADEFIAVFCPYAQLTANLLGVHPAPILAQAALETGWGKHRPGGGYNLFGIKAGKSWTGKVHLSMTTEYVNGKAVRVREPFRDYSNYAHAWADYARVIRGRRAYSGALTAGLDWQAYIKAVHDGGYATDPHYVAKVTSVIRARNLLERCPP